MRHVSLRPPLELLVDGVHDLTLDRHDDGLVLRVGYHGPLHNSPWHISRPLGCRRLPAMRPLTEDGLDAGDVPADFAHPGRVLELTARLLKAQVERFLPQIEELIAQLVVRLPMQIDRKSTRLNSSH